MTTITIDMPLKLNKNHFKDINEFLKELFNNNSIITKNVGINNNKYIESEEYKNEEFETFDNMEDLVKNLNSYRK